MCTIVIYSTPKLLAAGFQKYNKLMKNIKLMTKYNLSYSKRNTYLICLLSKINNTLNQTLNFVISRSGFSIEIASRLLSIC